jgi:antitoxin ParD1/3/4
MTGNRAIRLLRPNSCRSYQILVTCAMATKTTSIALGPELAAYARRKVESGEFGSTSEVIRDALRRAAEDDVRLQALRQALIDGENSGPPVEWSIDEFLKEMHARHRDAA